MRTFIKQRILQFGATWQAADQERRRREQMPPYKKLTFTITCPTLVWYKGCCDVK